MCKQPQNLFSNVRNSARVGLSSTKNVSTYMHTTSPDKHNAHIITTIVHFLHFHFLTQNRKKKGEVSSSATRSRSANSAYSRRACEPSGSSIRSCSHGRAAQVFSGFLRSKALFRCTHGVVDRKLQCQKVGFYIGFDVNSSTGGQFKPEIDINSI